MRPSVEQVAEALRCEFGGSLAHDPHNPERFWTSTARAVLRVFESETVTTDAELDALPDRSVVLDANGEALQRHGDLQEAGVWHSAWGGFLPPSLRASDEVYLPATVLYRPEETP